MTNKSLRDYINLIETAEQGVAEGSEQINEYRDRLLQYVKSLLPTWPEYVLKDWLVPNKGDFSNLPADALKNSVMEKVQGAGLTTNSKWQLVPNMKFTMDMFDPKTKQLLIGRAGGSSDLGMGIPKDKERHATQAALAQQQGGVRKEPVLLIKTAKGYELLEGWHRTIQHFVKYPNGYTGPAYVTVAQGQQGVAEGKLIESAVFLNPTTVIVGQAHGQPLELSPNTLKQIQAIAAKHGAYYEGNGTDRAYTKGQIDRYIGSWDDEVAKTASPNDPKWVYVLFANVDANNRVQRVGIDPKDTIFNRLLATAKDNSFQGIGYTSQALQKFLQMSSEGQYDFVKMSQQPATQENLTRFLKAGEALMWPSNWEQYPNKAGKIAKAATVDVRDQYLATRKAGVYVTGSGHLKAVQNITGKQGVAESVSENTDDLLEFQLDELAAWHGSFLPRIGKFKPFSHFGSEQAARERLEWMAANDTRFKGQHTGFLYRLDLGITAPAKVKDYPNLQDISTGSVAKIEKWCNDIANDPRAKAYREDIKEQVRLDQKTQQPVYRIKTYSGSHLLKVFGYNTIWGHWHEWGVTNQQRIAQFVTLLKKMGIDGLVYKNQVEHKGELSYIAFDASSVRVIGRAKPVDLSKFVTRVKKPGIKVKPKFSKFIKDPTTKPNAVTVTDLSDVAESNVFTDARMNAIKAGKDTFVVHGKTYKVTGDTTDERQAEITEDITVTDNPRIRAWIRNIDVSLTKNMRNLFSIVIGLSHDLKTADAVSRSQVIKVLDDKKPEILKYILYHIKHLDEINIKYYVDAMIEIGINWPELKTIQQALAHGNKTESVTENDYRFSNDHKVMSGLVADEINSWLESLSRNIKAGSKIPNQEIDSFKNVIYAIRNFSYYRLNMLQPVLEQHKKTIIYMILYILKYHSNNLMESEHILSALKYAKINWPELKTIQQALAQGSKTESMSEAQPSEENPIRDQLNVWMDKDQKYSNPTKRKSFQSKEVWPYIQKNMAAILADKGDKGNGDYPAAPYAAWLLVQHMDAFPQAQASFYKQLAASIPNHPKLQFLKDRSAVNTWILKNANSPEYYHNGKPLPDPTVNVRNPDLFKDASVKPKSREEALRNAEQAGNKLLVAAVKATNAQTQPSYTQQNESVEEADDYGKFKTISDMIARDFAEHPVRGFYMMLYWLDETKLTVADMPEIKPLVDKVKPDVIRALLLSIKEDDQGVNFSNVLQVLDRMQNCGVDWPEIDKIRQGLQHGRNTESVTEASDDNTFELLQKKLATIGRKFNKYDEDSEYWVSNGFPQIQGQVYTLAALGGNNQVIHEISIVYNLKSITDNSRPYQIRPKKFISFGKQKLQELLDPRSVIEVFLHLIKTRASDTQMFKQILKDITKLKTKYDWPELDVIYKALEYQLKPKLPAVTENKYKQAEAEQYASLISSKLEQASKLQGNANYDSHMMYFLEAMLKVGQIGPGYGQILTPILEHYKPVIIRHLLLLLKQNKLSAVENILEIVFNIHIQWSELETIKKALAHGKKQTTEARDASLDPLSPWVRALENDIQTKLYWHIAITLEELSMHLNDGSFRVTGHQWAQAAEQLGLNAHKDIIIKSILENLRDNIHSGNSTDWLQRSISTQRIILQKLGCNWPEMDRIAAAVGH